MGAKHHTDSKTKGKIRIPKENVLQKFPVIVFSGQNRYNLVLVKIDEIKFQTIKTKCQTTKSPNEKKREEFEKNYDIDRNSLKNDEQIPKHESHVDFVTFKLGRPSIHPSHSLIDSSVNPPTYFLCNRF